MSEQESQNLGRLDDDAEAREPSSTHEGPAAAGEYDPAQGSPHSGTHPVFHTMARAVGADMREGDGSA